MEKQFFPIYYVRIKAKRIYDYNSKAKIIIMLRHPIDRAFSHFLMDKRLGACKLTFEQILNDPNKYLQYFQQYLKSSLS